MSETGKEAAETAAIRRRWITLGEVLAVVAVTISGLTLWNSYSERSGAEAEKQAARQQAAAEAQRLILRGTRAGNGKQLALAPLDPEQVIQSQTLRFPTALDADAIDTVIDPRIEAGWLEPAVKKAGKAKSSGDARLPVLITTRFVSDGRSYADTSIYDVGYKAESGFLSGTDVELRGLSHVERVGAKDAQAKLDGLWERRQAPLP